MTTISSLVDSLIGFTPTYSETDVNGLITRVTDWRYIACAVMLVLSVVLLYHSLITILRMIGGRKK